MLRTSGTALTWNTLIVGHLAEDKDLDSYERADIAMALCRMVSYNIAQLAYLNAKRFGLKRIFFGV